MSNPVNLIKTVFYSMPRRACTLNLAGVYSPRAGPLDSKWD